MTTDDVVSANQGRLFGIAYRMLGEIGEAEDAVQEAFLRWTQADQAVIDNPAGWLTTVTSRICLDRLKSAQRRRETYVGPWLPEPLATDDVDPADITGTADSLNLAFLVVLEQLSPVERAVFLLHDVFGYRHDEIAAMLDRSAAAVRQAASRARSRLAERRPRYEPDAQRRDDVTRAFVAAVAGADLDALMDVLAPDVTFVADGGGIVAASRHPQRGARRVGHMILSLARLRPPDWTFSVRELNGEAGICVHRADGAIDSAWILHAADGRITGIDVLRNPAKLANLTQRGTGR
jgi:RNA polymerase sigma-70 factor (ECF subfamily)